MLHINKFLQYCCAMLHHDYARRARLAGREELLVLAPEFATVPRVRLVAKV
jgi:hypothetical protein